MQNFCKLKLNISNMARGFKADEKFFKKITRKTLEMIGLGKDSCIKGVLEVDLAFVDETEMKKINKKWRGKNKATDVLSFSEISIPQGRLAQEFDLQKELKRKKEGKKSFLEDDNLMQVIICPDYAKKQAKKFKYTQKQELAMLMAHGILHILGYDHERSDKEEEVMWLVQNKIIEKLK